MDDAMFKKQAEEENGQNISVAGDSNNADYRRGFRIGMAQSGNHIADREVNPTSITFRNGWRVFLNSEGFLDVAIFCQREKLATTPAKDLYLCLECEKELGF